MEEENKIEQKPYIKLCKMSKGYNWEIKLLEIDLDKLEEINGQMVEKYGNK